MTCLNSTLLYISSHAKHYGVTPIVTFDQPLWWKALTIQEGGPDDSDIQSIVLRLGGFHTEMSFLGSIGHVMAGTGLPELLECIYARNTVNHMMSGKAVSRAVRGHLLVSGALNAMIISKAFGIPVPHITSFQEGSEDERNIEEVSLQKSQETVTLALDQASVNETDDLSLPEVLCAARKLYEDLMDRSTILENIQNSHVMQDIDQKLTACKDAMQNQPTAKLWLQYLEMISILQTFIKAERTGNWQLHLKTIHRMLPYLAATGHHNYTRALHLYLSSMSKLQKQHPEVYQHFQNGLHIGR